LTPQFFIGLDLGQKRDPAAVVIVQPIVPAGARDPATWSTRGARHYAVRYVERLKLGVSWAATVDRVARIVRHPELAGGRTLVVDATGVGGPVVEMLRDANLGCTIVPVVITGGHRARLTDGQYSVPRKELLGGVRAALERGRLRIAPGMAEGRLLLEEMYTLEEGKETRDDIVMALSLALWRASVGEVGERQERPPLY
jgi:hypothetical protein